MKDTIYFRHDYDSQTDPKLIKLMAKYRWEWYWLFRATLECMRWEWDVVIYEKDLDAIAYRLHYECNAYIEFMKFCCDIWLLIYDNDEKLYYSKRLQDDVEHMRSKSKKAKASANARWKARNNANALQSHNERNAIKDNIRKEKKEKKENNNNSLTVVNETQGVVEYWNSEINDLQNLIIATCKENWLLYSWKWQMERNMIKHLLSKKMKDRLAEIWMTIDWMIRSVIPISSRMQYQKALTSWKMIYYEWENVYNKAKSEFWQKRHVDLTLYNNQPSDATNQDESVESKDSPRKME